MGLDWCLVRCKCGHSFGHRKGAKAKCTICGSNEVTNVQQFSDSRSLANAVADANLPKELAKELSSRLESKSAIEENRDSAGLDSESWESIIGGAELEGILVRCSTDSWRWV